MKQAKKAVRTKAVGIKRNKGVGSVLATTLKKNWGAWLLILPAIICIYLFIILPQIKCLYWSFFNMKGYTAGEFVGLANYRRVLTDTTFLKVLWNTCQYVIWSLLIGAVLPVIVAVVLNELIHMRKTFRFFVYLPSALPGVAIMMLWYLVYYPEYGGLLNMLLSKFGMEPYVWLQDERWTILYIIISMTWSGAGGTAIYYFAALQGVNKELYEAAMMDGAGFIRRFRVVTFPHISGVFLLFLVRQIVGVFSIMEQPMQMTEGGPNNASMTLGLMAYRYGFVNGRPQLAMAVGTVMFLILLVLTCFYFRINKKIESNF